MYTRLARVSGFVVFQQIYLIDAETEVEAGWSCSAYVPCIKYHSVSVCVYTCLPPIPYSLSRNDSRDRLECYVWTRFAIIRASCTRARWCIVTSSRYLNYSGPHGAFAYTRLRRISSIVPLEVALFHSSRSRKPPSSIDAGKRLIVIYYYFFFPLDNRTKL